MAAPARFEPDVLSVPTKIYASDSLRNGRKLDGENGNTLSLETRTELRDSIGSLVRVWSSWFSLRTWQGRLALLMLLLGPAWFVDEPLSSWNLRQFRISVVKDSRDVARQFGETVGILWIGIALWCVDRSRRRPLIVTLLVTVIAGGAGATAKLMFGRERPKASDSPTVFRGPQWPGAMKPDPSFPSGHTVAAFAFAYGLSAMYPRHRGLFVFLAASCGLSRMMGEAHFLTDVLVGAWLGWELARICWRGALRCDLSRLNRRVPASEWLPDWNWSRMGSNEAAG